MKHWLIIFSLLIMSAIHAADRPNIIFILADDLGYSDVVFNQLPGTEINDMVTPNIDALADDGTVFTSAYAVHPFCGPSRAGLLTGRYPHALGSQFNLAAFSEDGVDVNETFFSKVLQDAGYFTGIIGKWHLGEEPQFQPNNRGFDEFYGFLGGGHKYFSDDYFSPAVSETKMTSAAEGSFAEYSLALMRNATFETTPNNQYLTDVLTNEGMAFLDKAKTKTDPFFLFMSYNAPHTLLEAKAEDIATLKAAPYNISFATEDRATYSAMMYALDKQIKVLTDELKANGQYDNTLIVFMSDNGGKGPSESNPNSPLRGKKGDVHEGGYRVPMFIHWPASTTGAPEKYEYVVSGLDLYPTFVNLAKGILPVGKVLDGKDILPSVLANVDVRSDEPLFALRVMSPNNQVAARQGKWKVKTTGTGTWDLYDVTTDYYESHIVTDQNAIKEALIDDAHNWVKTHINPLWFDGPSYGFETKWNEGNMPNWEKTFPGYSFTSAPRLWQDETLDMGIFPNPVSNRLNVEVASVLDHKVDIAIYNIHGQVVCDVKNLSRSTSNTLSFDISNHLIAGTYILKLHSGDDVFSEQFIVKK